jgi:hypothetical protein
MSQPAGSPVPWAARAITASVGVLGWLAAQHLTFGLVEHTHLVADGHIASHEHHYAGPVALAAVVILGAGLAAALVGGLRAPGWRPRGAGQRPSRVLALPSWRRHSALAVLAFAAVELIEQFLAGDSARAAQLAIVIGVGAAAQAGVATVARQLSLRLLDAADTLAAAIQSPPVHALPRLVTLAAPRRREHRGAQAIPSACRGRAPPPAALIRDSTAVPVVARQTAPLPR